MRFYLGSHQPDSAANPTPAQVATARGYLRACVEYSPNWTEEHTAVVDALPDHEVISRVLRLWPRGWDDFCEYFSGDIRDAGAELDQTKPEPEPGSQFWSKLDELSAKRHELVCEGFAPERLMGPHCETPDALPVAALLGEIEYAKSALLYLHEHSWRKWPAREYTAWRDHLAALESECRRRESWAVLETMTPEDRQRMHAAATHIFAMKHGAPAQDETRKGARGPAGLRWLLELL
ncbi:hypothetical protein ACW9HH_36505 [Nocardia gipuzkoensis]